MTVDTSSKIIPRSSAADLGRNLRDQGRVVVFTNGCFDIVHAGHVASLEWARNQGDVLVVGLNSDDSVRRLKGPGRPVVPQQDRARVLAALQAVDYVVIFEEDEPAALIGDLLPQVLVKGGDWSSYISGADIVRRRGGRVLLAPMLEGRSTTGIINTIIAQSRTERSSE